MPWAWADLEKVVNPSILVASRIMGRQQDFDQVSRTCCHLDKILMIFTIFGLTLFNFGAILAIFYFNTLKLLCKVPFQWKYSHVLRFSWSGPEMTKPTQFVMPKLFKITHNLLCEKCWKSRYFCGRILARTLRSRKVYEVFHVCLEKVRRSWGWAVPSLDQLELAFNYPPLNFGLLGSAETVLN